MRFLSKNRNVSIEIIPCILNIVIFLYVFLFQLGFVSDTSSISIVIVLSLVVGQIWFFLTTCTIKEYNYHKNLNIPYSINKSTTGLIVAAVHIALFLYIYEVATESRAQSPLLWIYMAFVDFPLTAWFHFLLPLFGSLRVAGIVIYGIFGTLFWYSLIRCIVNHFISPKTK